MYFSDSIAGFFCNAGSASPAPPDQKCPAGSYCGFGTIAPSPCSPGTYNPNSGSTNESSCLSCPPGQYCSMQGLSAPSGPCSPGFYCTARAITPNTIVCPVGFYCPHGAASPLGCPDSTYQLALGSSACLDCSAGYYCQGNATKMTPCPSGFFCPRKSAAPQACPAGTIGPAQSMLTSILDCIPWYAFLFFWIDDEPLDILCLKPCIFD